MFNESRYPPVTRKTSLFRVTVKGAYVDKDIAFVDMFSMETYQDPFIQILLERDKKMLAQKLFFFWLVYHMKVPSDDSLYWFSGLVKTATEEIAEDVYPLLLLYVIQVVRFLVFQKLFLVC